MQLLNAHSTFIQTAIQSSSDSQSTTDDSTDTSEEVGKTLRASLTVDNLHRGDIVVEEDTWNTAAGMYALLMALRSIISTGKRTLVRGDRVLVSLDTTLTTVAKAVGAKRGLVVGVVDGGRELWIPA